jgi:hypothetical protein
MVVFLHSRSSANIINCSVLRSLAIKCSDWCEKRNKKYKDVKNCFIFIQSNLRLLEYICCAVQNVSENC